MESRRRISPSRLQKEGKRIPPTRLLLVGGGHANVAVLAAVGRWTRVGVEVVEVTLVNDAPHLLYSGMTPEYI